MHEVLHKPKIKIETRIGIHVVTFFDYLKIFPQYINPLLKL